MPSLIFLTIAYQIQNIKWRYLFLILAAINLVFNLYHQMWMHEIFSITTVMLLFMLTPYFSGWWQKRNARSNPTSLLNFAKETYLVAKINIYRLLLWLSFLVLSIVGVCFYTGFTDQTLLGSLLAVFLLIYGFKHLFSLIMAPEWFLHDIETGYVFLSVFIACWLSDLFSQKLGIYFTIPMILASALCLAGFFLIKKSNRYLLPGCTLILADIIWQLLRLIEDNNGFSSSLITTQVVLVIAMVIGLIWLVKKPGIMPVIYLVLFQLFRFSGFFHEATDHVISDNLVVSEATAYALYLVCWMYIAPMLFWMTGLKQQEYTGQKSGQRNKQASMNGDALSHYSRQ